ncbi:Rha family transcriptional regulator [Caproiciproducens sp. CPB-2]|uniref:Rha family transcriptional regulator n=1 Tax=Caproiciproducens sp. CPB-2 TaxID=3030017 RepID=UPI0023DB6798|nr:Rha family transcriptional regulator [Caproiciproducens sp. CPB-2]MDF1495188.1 Rha family transcriptional regulator [Caproiciproducens sp. CPB-2]
MSDLVFLEPNKIGAEPFTTSDVIAECTGNNYRSVQRTIEKQIKALETFGRVRFEITPFKTRGGIQNKKIYHLNESQATLLITFLKNTPVVVKFKTELVRQFYTMRTELQRRQIAKLDRKPIRESLTDGIKALPETPHKSMWYKHYTDLIYRIVTGMSAKQLREERDAPLKVTASDYMSAEEIEAVAAMENRVAVMLEMGMDYQQIKAALGNLKITAHAG